MNITISFKWLIPLLLTACGSAIADSATIAKAVNKYYAGFPEEAVAGLEPLALSGDVEAQYLLGNMLYSLSRNGNPPQLGDPVKWYKMAADRKLPDAHYALGVIYQNRWTVSRDPKNAAAAIVYYDRAKQLGYRKATAALGRMQNLSGISAQAAAGIAGKGLLTAAAPAAIEAAVSPASADKPATPDPERPGVNSVAEDQSLPPTADPEPETIPAEQAAIASTAQDTSAEPIFRITLAEIADQCQQYTEAGFLLYSRTISGGLVTGRASVVQLDRDPENAGMHFVKFSVSQNSITVIVNMYRVPGKVAGAFTKGNEYPIAGIIGDSVLKGSSCIMSSRYYAAEGAG